MFKKLVLTAALLAATSANAALNTGDLAFTAFNADEDGWALTSFVDIAANTTVYFTDNEWNGTAFNTGESFSSWLSGPASILAGTVVRFSAVDVAAASASIGTFSAVAITGSSNRGTSATADTIYAYLGSSALAPTTFLTAISNAPSITAVAEGGLINTGLVVGSTATQLASGTDFAQYTGARTGQLSFGDYKPLVVNVTTNWVNGGNGTFETTVPNVTAFTVAAVPEPETYALLVAGLGFVGFSARRKAV